MKCGVDWRENINWSSKGGHSMADMIDTAAISMEDVSVEMLSGREEALRQEMLRSKIEKVRNRRTRYAIG